MTSMISSLSYFCIMLCSSFLFMAVNMFLALFLVVSMFCGPNDASLSSKFKAAIYRHIYSLPKEAAALQF